MTQIKKTASVFLVALLLLVTVVSAQAQTYNYAEALQKSIYFYDAEKCNYTGTSRLEWRGPCHMEDVYWGGMHDAGDHVKFGLPQSYSASTLAWGLYEFKDAFVSSGQYDHMVEILRWFGDYFMRCWDGTNFVYQVGEGSVDHNYWGPPELQDVAVYPRPIYSTATGPASDQCSGAAAALTIMYLCFRDTDATYAASCLNTAKALYAKAVANRGCGYSGGFYNSSYDEDEMSWAAIWLYIATGTASYLNDMLSVDSSGNYTGYLKKIVINPTDDWQNIWVHSWDTVWGGVFAKLAPVTNDSQHWWFFRWNLEYWSGIAHEDPGDTNFLATTPAGFAWLNGWGSARYNAAAQLQAMVYRKYTGRTDFTDWAQTQMNYIMGNNPLTRSYIVGYSGNYAEHPHHRAAHGSTTNSMEDPVNHKHILWGALVGGPGINDEHKDLTTDYVYNEVACDYNAGVVGALAGMYYYYGAGQTPLANFPPLEENVVEYQNWSKLEQDSNQRTQITIKVDVQPVHPPRMLSGVKARYFFDISELVAAGQDISAVTAVCYYDQQASSYTGSTALNGPYLWSGTIYYMEIDWSANLIYGTREFQLGLIAAQDVNYNSNWSSANDPSMSGVTSVYALNPNIPVYIDGVLVYGQEPGGSTGTIAPTTPPTVTTAPTDVPATVAPTTPPAVTADPTTPPSETPAPTDAPTATPAPTETPGPTAIPTATPVGVTADPTTPPTTVTDAPTTPPTVTDVPTTPPVVTTAPTDPPVTGCTCTNLCTSQTAITVPFTKDGAGEFCYTSSSLATYVNSWNTDAVNVNGVNCTNTYTASSGIAAISGVYYIYYKGSYSWSHMEIK